MSRRVASGFVKETCLFLNRQRSCCTVRGTDMPVGENRRYRFCSSDNYDSCLFYLSYLLRRSRPQSRQSQLHEFLCK